MSNKKSFEERISDTTRRTATFTFILGIIGGILLGILICNMLWTCH